jgi:hypothetical protein
VITLENNQIRAIRLQSPQSLYQFGRVRPAIDDVAHQKYARPTWLSRFNILSDQVDEPHEQIEPTMDVANGVDALISGAAWGSFRSGHNLGKKYRTAMERSRLSNVPSEQIVYIKRRRQSACPLDERDERAAAFEQRRRRLNVAFWVMLSVGCRPG